MPAPELTEDDFLAALQAYLPRGAAWPRDPDAMVTQLLRGFAKAQARLHARENDILVDAFPPTTSELLAEWEASLGLPDPCIGPEPLDSERRALIMGRLTALGGQSIAYFTAVALALGYEITVTEFTEYRFGDVFGLPMLGDRGRQFLRFGDDFGLPFASLSGNWAFAWEVASPALSRRFMRFGDSFGGAFSIWSDAPTLRCEFQRLKPAHTTLIFVWQVQTFPDASWQENLFRFGDRFGGPLAHFTVIAP